MPNTNLTPSLVANPALNLVLNGLHLIEASAGTGKTYTLGILFIRLIVEAHIEPKQLIIATFTRAATADLKERMLARINSIITLLLNQQTQNDSHLAHSQQPSTADAFEQFVLQTYASNENNLSQNLKRLQLFKLGFDEVQMTTLDGLCQRLLKEFAAECGTVLRHELIMQNSALLRPLVHAAIRDWQTQQPPVLLQYLAQNGQLCDEDAILKIVQALQNKPNASLPWLVFDAHQLAQQLVQIEEKIRNFFNEKALHTLDGLLQDLKQKFDGRMGFTKKISQFFPLMKLWLSQSSTQIFNISKDLDALLSGFVDLEKQLKPSHVDEADGLLIREDIALLVKFYQLYLKLNDYALQQQAQITWQVQQQWQYYLEQQGKSTFSSQMQRLNDALNHPQTGQALAEAIFERYPYALVDEFQDTNQLQTDILMALYQHRPRGCLVLVGDPKQAIYGFRGGDIHAYVATKNTISQLALQQSQQNQTKISRLHALQYNQRSCAPLVNAVNMLLSQNPDMGDGIEYPQTYSGQRDVGALIDSTENPSCAEKTDSTEQQNNFNALTLPALRFLCFDAKQRNLVDENAGEQKPTNEVEQAARLVQHLLWQAQNGQLNVQPSTSEPTKLKTLKASNIAILCNRNQTLIEVEHALQQLGIASVRYKQNHVLNTQPAYLMDVLLGLWINPYAETALRALLISDWFGYDLQTLSDDASEADLILRYQVLMTECSSLWPSKGFMVAWQHFAQQSQLWSRLVQQSSQPSQQQSSQDYQQAQHQQAHHQKWSTATQRHLINVLHICDILEAQSQQGLGVHQQYSNYQTWLRDLPASEQFDEKSLPQSGGVQLMTIHASKGLEFDVVILLDHNKMGRDGSAVVYQQGQYQYLLKKTEQQKEQIKRSETAENIRKTYVALTRAVYRMYLIFDVDAKNSIYQHWMPNGAEQYALNNPQTVYMQPAFYSEAVYSEAVPSMGHVDAKSNRNADDTTTNAPSIQPNVWPIKPITAWRSTSFSAMITAHDWQLIDHEFNLRDSNSAETVVDVLSQQWDSVSHQAANALPLQSTTITQLDLFNWHNNNNTEDSPQAMDNEPAEQDIRVSFPRGAQSGNFLHLLLQYIDAKDVGKWQHNALFKEQYHSLYQHINTQALNQWLQDIVHTTLPTGSSLAQLAFDQQIRELDFQLYLPQGHIAHSLFIKRLAQEGIYISSLHSTQWVQYLNGAIDLVYQDGDKFYVADYKSNYLGDSPQDYNEHNMSQSMSEAGYWLQALLYLVVLHRHLRLRLPNYHINTHLGGAYYFYLRGIVPKQSTGILFWQPSTQLVLDVDAILQGVYQPTNLQNMVYVQDNLS